MRFFCDVSARRAEQASFRYRVTRPASRQLPNIFLPSKLMTQFVICTSRIVNKDFALIRTYNVTLYSVPTADSLSSRVVHSRRCAVWRVILLYLQPARVRLVCQTVRDAKFRAKVRIAFERKVWILEMWRSGTAQHSSGPRARLSLTMGVSGVGEMALAPAKR